jgi:hypothetical protein
MPNLELVETKRITVYSNEFNFWVKIHICDFNSAVVKFAPCATICDRKLLYEKWFIQYMFAGSFGHTLSGIKYNWTSASPLATENLELAQVIYLSNIL